jgi:hypothetical protein
MKYDMKLVYLVQAILRPCFRNLRDCNVVMSVYIYIYIYIYRL